MFRSITTLALVTAALLVHARVFAQEAAGNPFAGCAEPVRMLQQLPLRIEGRPGQWRYTLTGEASRPVRIVCEGSILEADEVIYETDTQWVRASGHVSLIQRDLTLYAERAEMDRKTQLGTFYNAAGLARIGDAPEQKSPFGTFEPDVMFSGERIEKTGPGRYRLHNGSFTTCAQPTPRWEFTIGDGTITLDKHAVLRNVVLKVKDVPLLYLPAFYYPMDKEDRSTGFLLPSYGASTFRGTMISNAFFLAISRSQDATFFHDWTSKSGQGAGAQYRYVSSPASRGNVNFSLFNTPAVEDSETTVAQAGERSITIDGDVSQGLPGRFRLITRLNYFSSVESQQMYQDVYDSYDSQRRSFTTSVDGNIRQLRLSTIFAQSDSFYGGSQQRTGRLPGITLSLPDRAIGQSKVYVGSSGEVVYFTNQDDVSRPATDHSLLRLDGGLRTRAPLSTLSFLTVTGDASWRATHWRESLDPLRQQVPIPLTRHLLDLSAQVTGPSFSRIFQTPGSSYADRLKHVIEPTLTVRRTTQFKDFDRVVVNDYSVDGQVGGVTQIDYGLSNKILARLAAPPGPPGAPPRPGQARQIVSVNLYQSYYSNARAAEYDSQYEAGGVGSFSPIRLRADLRPTDAVNGDFRMEIDAKRHVVTVLSASSRLEFDRIEATATWSKRRQIPDLQGFQNGSHFLGAMATVRSRNNHVGGSYRFNYDFGNQSWVQQRILAYYNSQCCGISFDWQYQSTPLFASRGLPTNTQFGISFTLAGIGSFSNPLGSFGGG